MVTCDWILQKNWLLLCSSTYLVLFKDLALSTVKFNFCNKYYLFCTLDTVIKLHHKLHCLTISLDKKLDTATCAGFGLIYARNLILVRRINWDRYLFLSAFIVIVILSHLLMYHYCKISRFNANISSWKTEVSIILNPDAEKIIAS